MVSAEEILNTVVGTAESSTISGHRDVSRDASFKRFFSRRTVLAATIKDSIKEFDGMSFDEVVECLVPDSKNPDFVEKLSEEITEFGNKVLLDVIFKCKIGSKIEPIQIVVDLEMQRSYSVGYPIIKRGIYYACQLVARQLKDDDYNKLSPVYSIWISRYHVPKELQNTVTRFRIHAENSDGKEVYKLQEDASLVNVDLILLSDDYDWNTADTEQVKFLQSIFLDRYSDRVYNPNVEVTENMMNEINDIRTEESQYRKEMDAEKQFGRVEGRAEGSCLKEIQLILNLRDTYTVGRISVLVDVSEDFAESVLRIASTYNTVDVDEIYRKLTE